MAPVFVHTAGVITDLHEVLQIAMGWSGAQLHHGVIHGKEYGVTASLAALMERGGQFSTLSSTVWIAERDSMSQICTDPPR